MIQWCLALNFPLLDRRGIKGEVDMRLYPQKHPSYSKNLRKQLTPWEQKLWYYLRAGRLNGLKFKRQVPIGLYIADFYCARVKLVIELDGGQHNSEKMVDYDSARSKFFNMIGVRVIRFWNHEIDKNINDVLEQIRKVTTSP